MGLKKVLILGAGFAGLKIAKDLSKCCDGRFKITLVDKSKFHSYTPDLYEIASSPHQEITEECLLELKEAVATEISKIVDKKKVEVILDEVIEILPKSNEVVLKGEKILKYDYLAICLGAVSNTYNIPGLEQFSYSVKSTQDAVVINCHLDSYFRELWKRKQKKEIVISVGGGGATGVEFASELSGYIRFLCKKYKYPADHVRLQIIQGTNELIGLGKEVSTIALDRLHKKNVQVVFGKYVNKVFPDSIELKSKSGKIKKVNSDMLMWTGGVKVNPVVSQWLGSKDCNGAILVNEFLQSEKYENIFAAGDNACFIDENGNKALMLAQIAYKEGQLIAKNILHLLNDCDMEAFHIPKYLYVIPIGGKFGIVKYGDKIYSGFWCWVLRRATDLWYAFQILPFWKALRKWMHGNQVFVRND